MKSKLARQSEEDLIAAMQRLTAEQRLQAFLAHCRLMKELQEAGLRRRSGSSQQSNS